MKLSAVKFDKFVPKRAGEDLVPVTHCGSRHGMKLNSMFVMNCSATDER